MKLLWVRIDLERVRQHMAAEDKEAVSADAVMTWLVEAGFERQGEGWLIAEKDLGQLRPDEVTEVIEQGDVTSPDIEKPPVLDDQPAER